MLLLSLQLVSAATQWTKKNQLMQVYGTDLYHFNLILMGRNGLKQHVQADGDKYKYDISVID